MIKENNFAFIDGQNFYMGIKENNFEIDLFKFRRYLLDKYNVNKAYYFLGFFDKNNRNLYKKLKKSGFILEFRWHDILMNSKNKGNVDSDIIFYIMKLLYKKYPFNKVVLISGDGDYIKLINFLIEENKFKKILFPNIKYTSSLYKNMDSKYYDYVINFLQKIKKEGSL
ncbi:NYN domain-containing protein [Patescibacteria group bacterium]|nr:NYN domain-containing protein [Patescibacteria group bacterium]